MTDDLQSYAYEAISESGKRIRQVRSAPNEATLARVLASEGYTLINVKPRNTTGWNTDVGAMFNKSGPSMKVADKAVFARSMAQMLKAGLPVTKALEVASEQAHKRYKQAILDVRESVLQGSKLSDAMAPFPGCFDNVFIGYITVGEEAGTLPETFIKLADQVEAQNKVRLKIKSVTAYPKLVSLAIALLVLVILEVVVPRFAAIYEGLGSSLPAPTQFVVSISQYINPIVNFSPPLITITVLSPITLAAFFFAARAFYRHHRASYTGSYLENPDDPPESDIKKTLLTKTIILVGWTVGWNLLVWVYAQFIGPSLYTDDISTYYDTASFGGKLVAAFLYQQPFLLNVLSPFTWLAVFVFVSLVTDYIKFITRYPYTLQLLNFVAFKVPIFGKLNYYLALYRTLSTLSGAMQSGLQFTRALTLAGDASGSALFAAACERISQQVQTGRQVSDAFDDHPKLFTPAVRALTHAGEEAGEIPTMLDSAAETTQSEIEATVSTLGAKLEVGLLMAMGGVVGTLVVVLYLPIFSLATAATQNL